jgi:hypothetical protein
MYNKSYTLAVSLTKILCQSIWLQKKCRDILNTGTFPTTTLRAGIIVGSGSAFEIIRDLVNKLPIMIAPKWLNTAVSPLRFLMFLNYYQDHCSIHLPIIKALILVPDILTYREMLLGWSKKLKRWIWLFQWWLLNYHLIGCTSSPQLHKLACAFKQYACWSRM